MRIARVFPRKTSMAPRDDLAFFGPPTIETMGMDIGTLTIMTAVNRTDMQHLLRCIVLNAVMN